jgi:predicted patatin/cPLA2 family phospholipase
MEQLTSQIPDLGEAVLVVQGGGARASYSFGAALVALSEGAPRYHSVVCSSAAALAVAFIRSGQADAVPHLVAEAFDSRRLLSPLRPNKLVDVEFLVRVLVRERLRLDTVSLRNHTGPRFIIQTTYARTARPAFFAADELSEPDLWDALVATAAIPGLYETPVFLHAQRHLDGGLGDPVPLTELFHQNVKHVTAIWTRPLDQSQRRPLLAVPLVGRILFRSQSESIRRTLARGDPQSAIAMNLCRNRDSRVICVAPRTSRSISSRLSRDLRQFWGSAQLGARDMSVALGIELDSCVLSVFEYGRRCGAL